MQLNYYFKHVIPNFGDIFDPERHDYRSYSIYAGTLVILQHRHRKEIAELTKFSHRCWCRRPYFHFWTELKFVEFACTTRLDIHKRKFWEKNSTNFSMERKTNEEKLPIRLVSKYYGKKKNKSLSLHCIWYLTISALLGFQI